MCRTKDRVQATRLQTTVQRCRSLIGLYSGLSSSATLPIWEVKLEAVNSGFLFKESDIFQTIDRIPERTKGQHKSAVDVSTSWTHWSPWQPQNDLQATPSHPSVQSLKQTSPPWRPPPVALTPSPTWARNASWSKAITEVQSSKRPLVQTHKRCGHTLNALWRDGTRLSGWTLCLLRLLLFGCLHRFQHHRGRLGHLRLHSSIGRQFSWGPQHVCVYRVTYHHQGPVIESRFNSLSLTLSSESCDTEMENSVSVPRGWSQFVQSTLSLFTSSLARKLMKKTELWYHDSPWQQQASLYFNPAKVEMQDIDQLCKVILKVNVHFSEQSDVMKRIQCSRLQCPNVLRINPHLFLEATLRSGSQSQTQEPVWVWNIVLHGGSELVVPFCVEYCASNAPAYCHQASSNHFTGPAVVGDDSRDKLSWRHHHPVTAKTHLRPNSKTVPTHLPSVVVLLVPSQQPVYTQAVPTDHKGVLFFMEHHPYS